MTTPGDVQPPEQDAEPTAEHPRAAPGPTVGPPPGPPPYGPPVYGPPPGYPFAPAYREPWVNPSKKRAVGLAALAAAVVLLGGGFALGAAVGGHGRDGGGSFQRAGDGMQFGPGGFQPGQPVGPGRGHRFGPLLPSAVPSASTSVPAASSSAPAPSATSSGR